METALERAQREVFGVVFWFVVLPGPCGPVLYRLAAELEARWGRRADEALEPFGRFARRAFVTLDWIPARLAAIGFAIAGNFEDAISSWRTHAPAWPEPELGIVLASGAGAMHVQLGGALPREGGVDLRPDLGEGDATRCRASAEHHLPALAHAGGVAGGAAADDSGALGRRIASAISIQGVFR